METAFATVFLYWADGQVVEAGGDFGDGLIGDRETEVVVICDENREKGHPDEGTPDFSDDSATIDESNILGDLADGDGG